MSLETSPEESAPRNHRSTYLALGLFVLGLVLVGLATATSPKHETETVDLGNPLPVRAAEIQVASGYDVRREFIGRVEARRESRVGFELGGLLTSVRVEEGDEVSRGQELARLDTRRLQARRAELDAAQEQAAADLKLAELTRDRVREASDLNAVAPQVRDEAELGVRARNAGLERARSALASLDVELEKSRLLAPFDALVAGRMVDEGQVISAGTPVLHLLENSNPEVRIGIAGDALEGLEEGQEHTLRVNDRSVTARLRTLLPLRQRGTRSVDAIFELDADLGQFKSGDLARLEVSRRVEDRGFWLPLSALTESTRGLWAVYVVQGAAEDLVPLERREVELLHQEANRVFVRGRLEEGERIVLEGLHRLVPEQVVRILDAQVEEGGAS